MHYVYKYYTSSHIVVCDSKLFASGPRGGYTITIQVPTWNMLQPRYNVHQLVT